jgi:very-short-patch-repair endonuclease
MNEIERKFYDAFIKEVNGRPGITIEEQFEIGKYRVDFIVNNEFIIEIDGHEYHKTTDQREADYYRERQLQHLGYTVIRFTGTEVYHAPSNCAMEATTLILDLLHARYNRDRRVN